jgi:hypothetical protein
MRGLNIVFSGGGEKVICVGFYTHSYKASTYLIQTVFAPKEQYREVVSSNTHSLPAVWEGVYLW